LEDDVMNDAPLDSPLDRAVDLASWLIRTNRQRPAKAIYIAARKHQVDRHAVAERVGQRGGRRAAAVRDQGNLPRGRGPMPPAPPPFLPPAAMIPFLVVDIASSASELIVRMRPLEGPFAGRDLDFRLPPGWLGGATAGNRVTCAVAYRHGSDGSIVLHLGQFFWIEPSSVPGGGP
jgi:hypothetical protein